ncbi:lantibiotic dehydratase family protein [Chryseobacterium sp. ISL-6]|uniref:lantibiotic dehydratase family protein n=1 Tax=Chryseobacterium sp. ISL-6 TaxID=2819143 RepID=UPI001BEA60C2|nr:lantibiotic dehydratase family protein [Chryseobacterium sp. ISL-6]MBT2621270.1 lantibiotic dehydratase family protein [Chryseobacterium sp. ISL-6]
MSRFPYHFFEEYIVRTPLFSRKNFREKLEKIELPDDELREICSNLIFQEAIYLASPYLHEELNQWLNTKKLSPNQYQKLKNTILKYYSRMSDRCTPFGLFSGVGLGKFNKEVSTSVNYFLKTNQLRDTKLDMHFLVALSQNLVKTHEIRNQLLFSSNNSIYKVGNKIRYVEYEYNNGKRYYTISSAPFSNELQQILDFSKQGKTIEDIASILVDDEIAKNEAKEFVEELIDNQVLISELEPNVSGNDFLDIIISVLDKIGARNETEILISIKSKLNDLDLKIGNLSTKYTEIEELVRSLNVEYEQKYLFQTDLYNKAEFCLPSHWKIELKKAISFLNKITLSQKDNHLEKFKKAFYERFETDEVSLTYALDTELGIGYRQDSITKGVHPYLEDLDLPLSQEKVTLKTEFDPVQLILNEKLQEASLENQYTIELSDDDFIDFNENWSDLHDTISFMAEIISEENHEKLFIDVNGGSSAANLMARFCSESSEVQNLSKTIAKKEEELNSDYILAEIIHLPEARIGNVIRRPTLRQFEIPYLGESIQPKENQIPTNDLYISLKNNRIVLRSKELNKEVKPYLTNAHNYSANSLPVYHFLCDLHSQNIRSGLYFNWGDLKKLYQFLPRVEYQNIILSKAWWKISEKEIMHVLMLAQNDIINNKEQILAELRIWRNKRQIPQWIQWVQLDNKLTINLENYDLVQLFIDAVKKKKSIMIEEFIYNDNSDFMHQFIFSMYNKEKEVKTKN